MIKRLLARVFGKNAYSSSSRSKSEGRYFFGEYFVTSGECNIGDPIYISTHRIYYHYQDLNDSTPKRYWTHGRFWLGHNFIHCEWHLPAWHDLNIELSLNHYGDTAIGLSIGFFWFWIHICTENRKLYRLLEPLTKRKDQSYTNGRVIGLSLSQWVLRFHLWADPMEFRSKDPKWWSFYIDFANVIFGKTDFKKEVLQTGDAVIDMPEGEYPATYEVIRYTHKRPRWFAKSYESIDFNIPAGIPHWGKGENSYDTGMDGTFGISTAWTGNKYEAAKKIALRCLETRAKRGSLSEPAYDRWRRERLGVMAESEGV